MAMDNPTFIGDFLSYKRQSFFGDFPAMFHDWRVVESKSGSCVVSYPSLNSPKTKLKEIGVLNPGIESVGKAQTNMRLTALGSPQSSV